MIGPDLRPGVLAGPARCCDMHGRNCEPPSELCCQYCTEAGHPEHRDGSECAVPDLSARLPGGWLDLGGGVEVCPYVQGGVLGTAGLLERHDCTTGREHVGMLPFDRGQQGPRWPLVSVNPLTLEGSVLCQTCGLHGFITAGRWVPVNETQHHQSG